MKLMLEPHFLILNPQRTNLNQPIHLVVCAYHLAQTLMLNGPRGPVLSTTPSPTSEGHEMPQKNVRRTPCCKAASGMSRSWKWEHQIGWISTYPGMTATAQRWSKDSEVDILKKHNWPYTEPPSPFMISDVSSIRFRRGSKILHHHFQPGVKWVIGILWGCLLTAHFMGRETFCHILPIRQFPAPRQFSTSRCAAVVPVLAAPACAWRREPHILPDREHQEMGTALGPRPLATSGLPVTEIRNCSCKSCNNM